MSQLIKNLVDVSEYINDGKKLFEEHVTPTEIKYKVVRGKYDIDQIFEIRSKFESNSAVSISLSKEHIELYFKLDSGNKLNPLNSDLKLAPRQEYAKYYTLNGALYLSTLESLLENKSFISPNTIGYVMPPEYSIDIDTKLDWEIAELLMSKLL